MTYSFPLRRKVSIKLGVGGLPTFDVQSSGRPRGVGSLLGPSDEEIMTRLEALASNMRLFEKEMSDNAVFTTPGAIAKLPEAERIAHDKLAYAWADLYIDFWGTDDDVKYGQPGFVRGLYKRLKEDVLPMFYKDADMAEIKFFEERLAGIRKQYATLGYKESIEPPKPPIPPPDTSVDTFEKYLKYAGIAVVVGVAGYMILITQPVWAPAIAGVFASRRTA
jgi:hypothetical protein